MDDFSKLLKQKADFKKARNDKYKEDSKTRLSKIVKKKIQTTMVGAISSIEEHLGFLWESADDGELTDAQAEFYVQFQKLRSEIFDKGNAQARNVDAELNQYEVEWKKYHMDIPMKPRSSFNKDEE